MAYIISSGITSSGISFSYDSMTVLDGGTADAATVNTGGRLYVFSGGEANSTTVNYSGAVYVESGGTTDNTTVKSSGYLVASGGTAFNTTANSGALVEAVSGGNVNTATVNNGGRLFAQSKGILNRATVNPGGSLYVNPGGTATEIIENGGYVWMTNGHILVSFASNAFSGLNLVNGSATVHSGTTAVSPSVSSGGELHIYSGGTASDVVWTPCEGRITVEGGGQVTYASQYSGIYYGSNGILLFTTGTLDGKTIGGNGEMYVMAGATTTSSIVSGGRLCVASGGIAGNTTVNGGTLAVASGGTANSTTVNGGVISVSSGGTANDAAIGSNCRLELSAGAVANRTVLNSWGSLYVSSGGTAHDTVNSIGQMFVSSGGYASNIRLYGREDRAEGDIYVSYGGFVEDITVEEYGDFYVSSGGTANKTRINSNGNLEVSSGGTANNTTVSSGGSMYVSSGGTANNVTVCGGSIFVLAGGTANIAMNPFVSGTVISNEGAIVTYDPGDANIYYGNDELGVVSSADVMTELNIEAGFSAIVYQDGLLDSPFVAGGSLIMSGGTANNTTVNAKGSMYISSGGTANNTTVNSGGFLYVSNGGTANNTTVNSKGYASGITLENGNTLIVSSGGTAAKTTVKNGGVFIVENGGIVSGITIVKDGGYVTGIVIDPDRAFTVSSGGTANSITVFSYGNLSVLNKGVATNTRIESWGSLYISSGGTAYDTTVNIGQMFVSSGGYASKVFLQGENHRQEGDIYLSGGGGAEDVTVGDFGDYYVFSGGTAIKTTVNSTGNMEISGQGTATEIIENGGYVGLSNGAQATFVSNTFSGLVLSGWYSETSGKIQNSASVHSGTTALNTEVQSDGVLMVFYSGYVNSTTIYPNGVVKVSSGGTADNTIFKDGGRLLVSGRGVVNSTTVNTRCYLEVSSNGTATAIAENGGYVSVQKGANVTFVPNTFSGVALSNSATVHSGTTANDTKINANGCLFVYSGGVVNSSIVSSGGSMMVYSGGEANTTTVYGNTELVISPGGVIEDTKIYAGGTLKVASGGCMTGKMSFLAGALVYVYDGANILFDLSRTAANGKALLSDWSLIQGTPDYTITVKDDQETGVYKLADSADEFDGTITVQNVLGESLGTLALGQTVTFGDTDYTLNVTDGTLSVTLGLIAPPVPTAPTGLMSFVVDRNVALVWDVSTDDSVVKEYVVTYSLGGEEFTVRTSGTSYVLKDADYGTWSWSVQAVDFAGNESAIVAGDAFTISGFKPYTVEYSADNFEHVITFAITTPSLDAFCMPTGTYQMRVKQESSSEWMTGDSIVAPESDMEPQLIKSDADGNADVFFANSIGTWESGYLAQHVGSTADTWGGTKEYATLFGKNKLADIIEGSTDANILLMTDDENGDALFVDDIYTASPGNIAEKQSRIAQIDEIRAGAGADIVDMTSQRFEYIGEGLTIRGGEGNDTIWANKGDNILFGDAGNDRIVGASGNDVIAGGIGNDRLHGGGGEDVFTFCDNWGMDNVEQLAGGSVMLWFASGSLENWNESTLTYNDGTNSVKVSGITADKITLKFGDDASDQYATLYSMGAFFDATSERIFEVSGKGLLVSL